MPTEERKNNEFRKRRRGKRRLQETREKERERDEKEKEIDELRRLAADNGAYPALLSCAWKRAERVKFHGEMKMVKFHGVRVPWFNLAWQSQWT